MRLLIEFLRQYPRQCLLVWGCLVLAGIGEGISLSTLLPLLSLAAGTAHGAGDSGATQMLTHALHFFALSPTLPVMVVLVVLGLLLKTGLTLAAYRQVGYTVAHIATDCRLALLRALSNSRWEYFLRQRSGSLTNAIATEASRSAAAFQNCTNTSALLSQSVVFLIVALLVNWRAAVLAMGIGVVIFTLLRKMVRVSRRAGNRQKDMFRALLALLTDSLTSLKPLKSMAREADIDHLLERATHKLNRALRKEVLSREALKALQELLVGLMLVLIVVLSLVLWHLKLAEIMVLTVVLTRLLTKLTKLQQAYQKLAVGEAFYWSLQAAIKEAQNAREPAFGRWPPTLRQGIRLEHAGFGYDQHRVFDGVDMDIPAGRFTAIIGFSGAGKTTLVDLIIGLLRTDSGRVLIDGVGIDDIDIRAWRGMIGYVPQNTVLLHDTIFANVAVGDDQITAENAIWALKKAGAWGFIESLPEGMDTEVGEHGNRFSGGQRQRILIARALVHRPKLLILDEATSALDPETEKAVSQTLRNLGADYTVISISHRSLLTELADRVYRIENGHAIIEQRAVQRVSGMV